APNLGSAGAGYNPLGESRTTDRTPGRERRSRRRARPRLADADDRRGPAHRDPRSQRRRQVDADEAARAGDLSARPSTGSGRAAAPRTSTGSGRAAVPRTSTGSGRAAATGPATG